MNRNSNWLVRIYFHTTIEGSGKISLKWCPFIVENAVAMYRKGHNIFIRILLFVYFTDKEAKDIKIVGINIIRYVEYNSDSLQSVINR